MIENLFNSDTLFIASIGIGVLAVGIVFYVLFASGSGTEKRVSQMSKSKTRDKDSLLKKVAHEGPDSKRSHVQQKLKELEKKNKARKRMSLKIRIEQAGLTISPVLVYIFSFVFGLVMGLFVLVSGATPYVALGAGFASSIGVPLWILNYLRNRRQRMFMLELPNALDIIIRGVKSGMPLNDGFKVVAQESPAPVGPEFALLVEGQKLGLTLDQGLERMFDRMPIAEVNFLSIVIAIQQKAGGNLAEALANLSGVLRGRKRMQGKIRAVSQEAKSSAAIIGSLPFGIMGIMSMTSPEYIEILWTNQTGKMLMIGSGVWMLMGILVMRKMINFKI